MKIAKVVRGMYERAGERAEVYGLEEMPATVFEPGAYGVKPAEFVGVMQRVVEARGLHVVTPEYNGSFPGVLKYFIDMLKFPESFEGKPVAFIGEANGMFGGLRAVEQLQQVFGYRNAYVYPQRVFVARVGTVVGADGVIGDAKVAEMMEKQVAGFARFVAGLGAMKG